LVQDWYFSGAGMRAAELRESGPKAGCRRKHMQRIKREVEAFLEISVDWQVEGTAQEYLLRAKRGRERPLTE
jgi:hypothetical protein